MDSSSDGTPLQFDTAHSTAATSLVDGTQVTCSACHRALSESYFDVNGQPVCESCCRQLEQHAETPRQWRTFARATLLGFIGAVIGAILYYAVIAITDFEIGIVAIAIGYMVGYAIRLATAGRGGRRFQVLAVVLTYWAVGLAYVPFVFQGSSRPNQTAQTETNAPAQEVAEPRGENAAPSLTLALAFLAALSLALPVISIAGSLPGGLISAAIIAFGMQQAWRMTGAPQLQISGPYRIGPAPAALT